MQHLKKGVDIVGWMIVHIISGMVVGIVFSKFTQARNDFSIRKQETVWFWGLALCAAVSGMAIVLAAGATFGREAQRIEWLQEKTASQ